MTRSLSLSALVILLLGLVGYAAAQTPPADGPTFRRVEIHLEGGLGLPMGDLSAPVRAGTPSALGAEAGYMLGLRTRFFLSRSWTLAPSFNFTQFGDYDGFTAAGEKLKITASVLRYGLDLVYLAPGSHGSLRPFVGGGAAFVHNKYHEDIDDETAIYDASVNALSWSVVAGLRLKDWELSLQYDINRFSTPLFYPTGEDLDYNWNSVLLRIGYVLPRI